MKRALAVGAWALAAVLAFALFARPGAGAPWAPAHAWVSDPNAWQSDASLRVQGAGAVATGADAGGATLLLQPVPAFDAGRYRYVDYSLDLARSDKAYVVWRSGGQLRSAALAVSSVEGSVSVGA